MVYGARLVFLLSFSRLIYIAVCVSERVTRVGEFEGGKKVLSYLAALVLPMVAVSAVGCCTSSPEIETKVGFLSYYFYTGFLPLLSAF